MFLLITYWLKQSLHPDVVMASLNILPTIASHKVLLLSAMYFIFTHSHFHMHIFMSTFIVLISHLDNIFQYNTAPVLQYLKKLSISGKTMALSIRLLADVCKLQTKAYPHLLQSINAGVNDRSEEVIVAAMLALRQVCDERLV